MRTARPALQLVLSVCLVPGLAAAAEPPSVKLALTFRPVHQDVEIQTPTPAEYDKCQVKVERGTGTSGWVVMGTSGEVLRRFVDTNADNVVDEWRYYLNGLEVYRDIDSNHNNKVDQFRWLSTAGTRWGLDRDEDGSIDEWKMISAEEVSREAVNALITRDAGRLQAVMLTAADARTLKLNANVASEIETRTRNLAAGISQALDDQNVIGSGTEWMRFDNSSLVPSLVPADSGVAATDLYMYQAAMAIVENGGETGLVQLGEVVRVGDTWKLTQIPQPVSGNSLTSTGLLMQPAVATAAGATGTGSTAPVTAAMRELLDELQRLDQQSPDPSAGRRALGEYNKRRADLLARLVDSSADDEQREQWFRQMVDGIAAAIQTGAYPDGLQRLEAIAAEVQRNDPRARDLAYVQYRLLLAGYAVRLQDASALERAKVQEWWLAQLRDFVAKNPQAEDAADALLQLAIAQEFSGQMTEARKWYTQLSRGYADTPAGQRATGALRRLALKGTPLRLAGSGLTGGQVDVSRYRGRVVVVLFWATWCQPCTEDLPQLKALYEAQRSQGLELVGVNLDATREPIDAYLRQHGVRWPQIHEPGGLESPPARQFGIISLPTMFLVDKNGEVVSANVSVEDLKEQLPGLLK